MGGFGAMVIWHLWVSLVASPLLSTPQAHPGEQDLEGTSLGLDLELG